MKLIFRLTINTINRSVRQTCHYLNNDTRERIGKYILQRHSSRTRRFDSLPIIAGLSLVLFFLLTWSTSADEKNSTVSLFNGQDLTNWAITDFGTQGQVKVENAKLILYMGEGATGVTWNGDFEFPQKNYEVSLKAMRMDGNDFFCGMTFPVNDDHLTLIVGGWSGTVVGLSSLDGFDASENETTTSRSFQKMKWYDIRLRVQNNIVQVWIENKEIISCNTADFQLSVRSEVSLSRPFGFASWYTKAALKDIRLTLLD